MAEGEGDDPVHEAGPYCVVWVYGDSPTTFERAARFALQNTGYGLDVVVVFTEAGVKLVQTDRMARLFAVPGLGELIDDLVERRVYFEVDIGSARRVGVVETLGSAIPNLRIADQGRLADLATGARITARY
jgi:predicted peroxiredoxin